MATLEVLSQVQLGDDIDGEAAFDRSGYSVSLSSDGNTLAIGAPFNSGGGYNAGHLRVFRFEAGSWSQMGSDMNAELEGSRCGWSVSLSSDGSIVAVGATGYKGFVRVLQYDDGSWTQLGGDIEGEAFYDNSGCSVSLSSDGLILAIGALGNDGNGTNAGHVRVYQFDNDFWTQLGNDIDGESESDESGTAVSLSSDGMILAVGAPGNDGNGSNSGHVRVFQFKDSSWVQLGKDIDGESTGDLSGYSVSLSSDGAILAIGAYRYNFSTGHVRVYKYSSGVWTQLGNDIDGDKENEHNGKAVSLSSDGTMLAVGTPNDSGSANNSGRVRIYKYATDAWVQLGNDIDGEGLDERSGSSVSLSSDGSIVAIGSPHSKGNNNYNSGQVRVYYTNGTGSVRPNVAQDGQLIFVPNPVQNKLRILNISNSTFIDVKIIDAKGDQLMLTKGKISTNDDDISIDLIGIARGLYFVQVIDAHGIHTGKFIKS